jgi:uncharacterized protein DUF6886
MPDALFHFSEDPNIEVFVPRPSDQACGASVVWAVDAWHAPHYYLPRDCPRACFWRDEASALSDVSRFLSTSDRVVAVEAGWLERIRSTTLYRYRFGEESFELADANAGYYVSRLAVKPLGVEPVGDLMEAIVREGVELQILPGGLARLHMEVVRSSLAFSGIRLQNAADAAVMG